MSSNTTKIISVILAVLVIGLGMFGLHIQVPYSGWVLALGILWVILN